jgi:hypothetical protein
LDGETTPWESDALSHHLAICVDCRQADMVLRVVRTGARLLPRITAPSALREQVTQLARADDGLREFVVPSARGRVRAALGRFIQLFELRSALLALPLAILIIACGVVIPRQTGVFAPRPVRLLVADHLRHVVNPNYSIVSNNPKIVGAYIRRRLHAYGRLQTVPAMDASLVGGRMCEVLEEVAAHISYVDPQHRPLSVYMLDARVAKADWGRTVVRNGRTYHVASCRGCWVVSWQWEDKFCAVLCPSSSENVLREAIQIQTALRQNS